MVKFLAGVYKSLIPQAAFTTFASLIVVLRLDFSANRLLTESTDVKSVNCNRGGFNSAASYSELASKLAPLSYDSFACMDQIASGGVHSESSQHLHYALQNQQPEVAFFQNSSSNNCDNNSMEMRARVMNWTSSEQLNTPLSSEMFSDAFMAPEWQQLAGQSGHLLAANRGEMPAFSRSMSSSSFSVKNPLNLQNGWPNLSNDLETVKSGGDNGSVVTATTCLAPFPSDPGLAERAAKFSSFHRSNANGGSGLRYQKQTLSEETAPNTSESVTNVAGNEQQTASSEGSKKICRTASCVPSVEKSEKSTAAAEGSVVSEKGDVKFSNDNAGRKRKNERTRPQEIKTADSEESKEKRAKSLDKEKDDVKAKTEQSNSDHSAESTPNAAKENSKPSENPKQDYIHVRARRGQATDSHSLAERVRREKISERMKYLQDLVPGCNKVTGKAVMLDEIINYVQSLQRQVEFLSMKLAAVNPRLDFSIDSFLAKEMMSPCGNFSSMGGLSPDLGPYLQFHQMQQHPSLQAGVCCGLDMPTIVSSADTSLHRAPVSADMYVDTNFQGQAPSLWDTELQNVFTAGLVQGRQPPFVSQGNSGHLDVNHMKMEL